MKIIKSYTARIDANASKSNSMFFILSELKRVSEYVFNLGKDKWNDQKTIYHDCRKLTNIHSKILQQFIKLYKPKGKYKLPKTVVKPFIILDNQTFNLKYDENTKYTNYWLRFNRINFPLHGKKILERIKDINCVKECRIFKRNNKLYCKLTYVKEVDDNIINDKFASIGLDINNKQLVLSNNKFYSTKSLVHFKSEYRKNSSKFSNLKNFTKDYLHKITTQIVYDLVSQKQEVLVLENLKGLRKSTSKKLGTSKGKTVNYIINSLPFRMIQILLEDKCLENGISVIKINPEYTSKQCNKCGSLNTSRPTQNTFICNECNNYIHADLNAARNIRLKYISSNGAPENLPNASQ